MTCPRCGAAVVGDARFCAACGATLSALGSPGAASPMAASPMAANFSMRTAGPRVERHLRTLGILWVVMGFYRILGLLIALPFLAGALGGMHGGPFGHGSMGGGPFGGGFPFGQHAWMALLPMITVVVAMLSGLSFLVGYALITRQPWGRVLAIVVAFLTLLKIPFGTALAIYTLWVLMPAESAAEYERMQA